MVEVNESLFSDNGNVGLSIVKQSKSLPSLKSRIYKNLYRSVSNLYILNEDGLILEYF